MSTPGLAIPGAVVPSGAQASPGGAQGVQGIQGVQGASGTGIGDMLKSVYDTNANNLVDNAEAVLGHSPPASGNAAAANLVLGSDSRLLPTGTVLDFAGGTAPTGFLLCDGTSYPTASYPALFSAIGYAWGGAGANFNVPDLRSRVTIGAGQGTGLANRALAAKGGEESHALTLAELAAHNHTASQPDHYHTIPGAGNHNHTASQADHQHGIPASGAHSHSYTTVTFPASGGYQLQAQAGGFQIGSAGATTSATGNLGPTVTYWASQTANGSSGIPAVTINNSGNITPNTAYESTTMGAVGVITVNNAGSGTPHNTMPPFAVLQKIIRT
jgi:microcystin-dependent protein